MGHSLPARGVVLVIDRAGKCAVSDVRTSRSSKALLEEVAAAKLEMVGISPGDGRKLPAELSGGDGQNALRSPRARA